MGSFGELLAEGLGFGKVDVTDGKFVSGRQRVGQRTWQFTENAFSLALGRLEFGHPKWLGERHLDLIFIGPPLRLIGRAAHKELASRTPAKLDAADGDLVASVCAEKSAVGN